MIRISTNEISLKSSPEELFTFLGNLDGIASVIKYKRTKHLTVDKDVITFILKWVARFNFKLTEVNEAHVLIESTEGVEFRTAVRFDITPGENGTLLIIHFETDTAPVIDFTFEKRAKHWIAAMAENFENQFG